MNPYPKRLIEVDLPIKHISEHARREKNLRSGHPWHLHIWWARRPWGVCRSVAFASLIPAPSDPNCPTEFIKKVALLMNKFGFCNAHEINKEKVEKALLKFTGELSRWEAGSESIWRDTAREIVRLAHPEVPIAFDPFSGYGAIPAETARLGCQSIANDLNPVVVLCLKIMLEAIPRYGEELLELYVKGSEWIIAEAEKRLSHYYHKKGQKYPIAYLWARTVQCEGPACGAIIPLISQTTISKGKRKTWIEITGNKSTKKVSINIKSGIKLPSDLINTAGGGHAVCPVCGTTTHKDRVKAQGQAGKMGNRLFGLAYPIGQREGKDYVNSTSEDEKVFEAASKAWRTLLKDNPKLEINEQYPYEYTQAFGAGLYFAKKWGDIFNTRQKLTLATFGQLIREYEENLLQEGVESTLVKYSVTALSLGLSNYAHYMTTLGAFIDGRFASAFLVGNAIAMRWEYFEANPFILNYSAGIAYQFQQGQGAIQAIINGDFEDSITVLQQDASKLNLPDDSADLFFTDPPYYDVVPYADLSDLCFVWLKRTIGHDYPDLLKDYLTPKRNQIVVCRQIISDGRGDLSPELYRTRMTEAFIKSRIALKPNGIGNIVFAHKGTAAWENLLSSVIDAGFVVTASWPIDTERAHRMRSNDSAALQASVHLVIRPRENLDGSLNVDNIGDWRDVLAELPKRIHEWMPRLSAEGVVGADAIFSCLGPALEIYSRYSRVEKASGEQVTLKEYLEQVWAVVAKEALNMIFEGADTSGFEEDARLTAMWLWTLSTGTTNGDAISDDADVEDEDEKSSKTKISGYTLEYDAARKIAQGLGAHLEQLQSLVEVKGDKARLLPVSERTKILFGKDESEAPSTRRKKKSSQMELGFMEEVIKADEEGSWGKKNVPQLGKTRLDRLHQAMILFAAGRGEALKRFLVEEGVGRDEKFWRLAQALSALYPPNTDERRWVEGVQARKKGFGF